MLPARCAAIRSRNCLKASHSRVYPLQHNYSPSACPPSNNAPLAQRFCGEAGVKLAKVNKVFLTGTGAEEHAGLSGLMLTLSALGSPLLEVFGPAGVDKLAVGETGERHEWVSSRTHTLQQRVV